MRTTVRLDDALLTAAKRYAAESGRTLTSLIEDALRAFMARGQQKPGKKKPRLTTYKGRGTQPGVDLDNAAALLDLMERGDASS